MSVWVSIWAAIAAFLVSAVAGYFVIPFLRKLHFGQTILDIGPSWHKSKQGTPIMGGLLFIGGTIAGILAGFAALAIIEPSEDMVGALERTKLFAGLGMAIGFAFIGFLDDYVKAVKKQNMGLSARQKLFMQVVICVLYLFAVHTAGDTATILKLPFIGQLNLGWAYYPLVILFVLFMVNAVNLTDGVDGLCGSVTFVYSISFMAILSLLAYRGLSIYAVSLAAACLGFLVWNFHPAKVFMGDTGSMFLGGSVLALGLGAGLHVLIAIAGIIYVCEALSVVLQVISFKSTGKRIFKMSPIHHHFEMSGWSEVKIVAVFSAITVVAGVLAGLCLLGI